LSNAFNMPAGTLTFLFTDIEGSTKRWENHPEAMKPAVERHDAILREAIEGQGGHVFRLEGDAFRAAFATAPQALAASVQAQQALTAEDWPEEIAPLRVRMALHTGTVEMRDADYVGASLNRISRLLAAAHGGQTLLSLATQQLVRDSLPPDVTLRDIGEYYLKDLIRPERVYQVIAPGLTTEFPPLNTLDIRPNNLPIQATRLIGREKELAEVEELLRRSDVRLLTLTGTGGSGKTRLALHIGANLSDEFPDGVYFVGLDAILESSLVAPAISSALAIKEDAGKPLIDSLKDYLCDRQMLLLLDNFEQVLQAGPDISQLLAASPKLKVLVTSRVPLRLRGEREIPVPPLGLPDTRHLPSLDRLTQYEAVKLFIERAIAIKPDFQITNENAPAVAEICTRLDGLPLAIELAAARVRLLTPQAMLARLVGADSASRAGRIPLLTGGPRDLPPRQQTLRNTIEWSHDLLEEGEKQLFRRLAVFQGGCMLEAIEAVCNPGIKDQESGVSTLASAPLQIDVLEGTESLISKSLLQQKVSAAGEPHYAMLETIHEYSREKLEESGELADLRRQHALYFMAFAEEAEPKLTTREQALWFNRLESEHDNLRAALRWAREDRSVEALETGLRIVGAIWRFWQTRGYYSEGIEQVQALLSLADTVDAQHLASGEPGPFGRSLGKTKALNAAGVLLWRKGDYPAARQTLKQALAMATELGDKSSMALAINVIGNIASDQDDHSTARKLYEQSMAIRREMGDRRGVSALIDNLAGLAYKQGDYAATKSLHQQSLAIQRELGDEAGVAGSLAMLGMVAYCEGDLPTSRALLEESLAMQEKLGGKNDLAITLCSLGNLTYREGDRAKARAVHERNVAAHKKMGDKAGIAVSLYGLGLMSYFEGDYQAADASLRESLAVASDLGAKFDIVLGLAVLGAATAKAGQAERAAKLLAADKALLATSGLALEPDARTACEEGKAYARDQLDERAVERAWNEGLEMNMEQATRYALEASDNRNRA